MRALTAGSHIDAGRAGALTIRVFTLRGVRRFPHGPFAPLGDRFRVVLGHRIAGTLRDGSTAKAEHFARTGLIRFTGVVVVIVRVVVLMIAVMVIVVVIVLMVVPFVEPIHETS